MAIPKIGEPAAVEVGSERQCKIANSREKENRSLNNLIAHIGDAVIRHVKNKQQSTELSLFGFAFPVRATAQAADGAHSMDFYHDFGGWTLVLSVLISAVVSDAFGIWMKRLSTH